MLRLGIDYGGKFTGLAVVDTRTNNVLYAKTVRMWSDIETDGKILESKMENPRKVESHES